MPPLFGSENHADLDAARKVMGPERKSIRQFSISSMLTFMRSTANVNSPPLSSEGQRRQDRPCWSADHRAVYPSVQSNDLSLIELSADLQ